MTLQRVLSLVFFLTIWCSSSVLSLDMAGGAGDNSSNLINDTSPRLPPTKSLFSRLFQDTNTNLVKTANPLPPLRESYIAFEQAHPGNGPDFDQYFKPNKFPYGFDTKNHVRIQNNYPYYPPYRHFPPPPPPPPPFLRLVRIPGEITINLNPDGTNDVEFICELPQYLIIVQQIYWHMIPPPHSLLVPYGTFYDSRNGFAPRVTVTSVSKWKSILRIRDFAIDDFGTYRCVTTAILPDDPETGYAPPPPPSSHPPTSYMLHFPHHDPLELRNSASTTSSSEATLSNVKFRNKREIGEFGVYAPFFKPHYGIYRIYKEVWFSGAHFYGAGSDVENSIVKPDDLKQERDDKSGERVKKRNGRRRFDSFGRKSKVLF